MAGDASSDMELMRCSNCDYKTRSEEPILCPRCYSPNGMDVVNEDGTSDAKPSNQSQSKQQAYEDRNIAVMSFLRAMDLYIELRDREYDIDDTMDVGWKEAPDEDDDWVIVWAELPRGQVSWHVPRELVDSLHWLEENDRLWDHHTRKIKNKRLKDFADIINGER